MLGYHGISGKTYIYSIYTPQGGPGPGGVGAVGRDMSC